MLLAAMPDKPARWLVALLRPAEHVAWQAFLGLAESLLGVLEQDDPRRNHDHLGAGRLGVQVEA